MFTFSGMSGELYFTGTQVNYYFVCKRKLWFFSHDFEMEQSSDLVLLGKLLHEASYLRKTKDINIGSIKIDFMERVCEIHDIKKSSKIENAHIHQVLYYLYYLKRKGIESRGVINYPLLRKKVEIQLTPEKEKEMEIILNNISRIISEELPPKIQKKSYCKKCSYYNLCWC